MWRCELSKGDWQCEWSATAQSSSDFDTDLWSFRVRMMHPWQVVTTSKV